MKGVIFSNFFAKLNNRIVPLVLATTMLLALAQWPVQTSYAAVGDPVTYPQFLMTAQACSEETTNEDGRISNFLDGNTGTFWHTQWSGSGHGLHPVNSGTGTNFTGIHTANCHWLKVDLNSVQEVRAIRYLPRSGGGNGTFLTVRAYYSIDGVAFTQAGSETTWANNGTEKTLNFPAPVNARHILLYGSACQGNYGSCAEFNVTVTDDGSSIIWALIKADIDEIKSKPIGNGIGQYPRAAYDKCFAKILEACETGDISVAGVMIDVAKEEFYASRITYTLAGLEELIDTAKSLKNSTQIGTGNGNVSQVSMQALESAIATAEEITAGASDNLTIHYASIAINKAIAAFRASIISDTPNTNTIIPRPVTLTYQTGLYVINASTKLIVSVDDNADLIQASGVAEYLAGKLRPSTGFTLNVINAGTPAPTDITLKTIAKSQNLATGVNYTTAGDEGYALVADENGAVITAYTPEGLFRGIQTIRQLLPPEVEKTSLVNGVDWRFQYINIVDYPRYEWRGIMMDVSRKFFTKEMVLRQIDLVSQYKINVVHLHLSEDQGFRIAFDGYPELNEIGGNTKLLHNSLSNLPNVVGTESRLVPGSLSYGGTPGYYTKADFQEIIDYADARFVMIVPEIEMPSHCYSQLLSLPMLNPSGEISASSLSGGSAFWSSSVGYSNTINPNFNTAGGKYTKAFIEDIYSQLADMLPERHKYIHIGADEADSTVFQDFYDVTKLAIETINGKGKLSLQWSPAGSSNYYWADIMQIWTGNGSRALAAGKRILCSPTGNAYLDMYTSNAMPIGHNWAGALPPASVYNWDPENAIPAAYRNQNRVVGVEGPLWAETYGSQEMLDLLIYPRVMSLAEVGWSPAETRSGTGTGTAWSRFAPRVAAQGARMTYEGITFANEPSIWPTKIVNVTPNNNTYTTPLTTPVNTPLTGKFDFDRITFAEGDIVAIKMASEPTQGTVELDQDGNWKYTPKPGFVGKDSFNVAFQVEGFGVPMGPNTGSNRGSAQFSGYRNVHIQVIRETGVTGETYPVAVTTAAVRPTNIRVLLDPPVPGLLAANFSAPGSTVRMAESFDNGSSYLIVTTPRNDNRVYTLSINKAGYTFNTLDMPVHNIVPKPASFVGQSASFIIKPSTKIIIGSDDPAQLDALKDAAEAFASKLRSSTGYDVEVADSGNAGIRDISMKIIPTTQNLAPAIDYTKAGDKGYALNIGVDGAYLTAYTIEGLVSGIRTISQLLPPEIESASLVTGVDWIMTYCTVADYPYSVEAKQNRDMVEANYYISNMSGEVKEALCILASYDKNGVLKQLIEERVSVKPFESEEITISMPFTGTPKAFLWDGLTYVPLCAASSVEWAPYNLALGKVATASSQETVNFPPINATDGDYGTRWSSSASNNQWLLVDLGADMDVSKVVLYWESAYGSSYRIETATSDTPNAFTTAQTVTGGRGGVETVAFDTVRARYVRFYGLTRGTSYGFSLYEFEIYGSKPENL